MLQHISRETLWKVFVVIGRIYTLFTKSLSNLKIKYDLSYYFIYYLMFNDAPNISICLASVIRIMNEMWGTRGGRSLAPVWDWEENYEKSHESRSLGLKPGYEVRRLALAAVSQTLLVTSSLIRYKEIYIIVLLYSVSRFQNSNLKRHILFLLTMIVACSMEDSRTFSIAYWAPNWSSAVAEKQYIARRLSALLCALLKKFMKWTRYVLWNWPSDFDYNW